MFLRKLYCKNIQNKQREQDITHCLPKKSRKRTYKYDIIYLHQDITINLNYEERSKTLKRSVLFHKDPRNKSMSLQDYPQRKYRKEQKMTR